MEMLKEYRIDPAGKRCVVLGRSNIVGKPGILAGSFFQFMPWCSFAAVRVFFISMARVIGPTPPGTGVM